MFIQPPLVNEGELVSFSGMVTLVVVITQCLRYAFSFQARWIGLIISVIISSVSTFLTTDNSTRAWLLMGGNVFVIYLGAIGIAEIGATLDDPARQKISATSKNNKTSPEDIVAILEENVPPPKYFWGSWFKK